MNAYKFSFLWIHFFHAKHQLLYGQWAETTYMGIKIMFSVIWTEYRCSKDNLGEITYCNELPYDRKQQKPLKSGK